MTLSTERSESFESLTYGRLGRLRQVVGYTGEKKYMSGDVRCDFHPRWNRAGDQICFDAIEPVNWTRQLHVVYFKSM